MGLKAVTRRVTGLLPAIPTNQATTRLMIPVVPPAAVVEEVPTASTTDPVQVLILQTIIRPSTGAVLEDNQATRGAMEASIRRLEDLPSRPMEWVA